MYATMLAAALLASAQIPADGDMLYPIAVDPNHPGTYIAIDLTSRDPAPVSGIGTRSAILISVKAHAPRVALTVPVAISSRVTAVCGANQLVGAAEQMVLNRKGEVLKILKHEPAAESVEAGSIDYAVYYGICNLPDNGTPETPKVR